MSHLKSDSDVICMEVLTPSALSPKVAIDQDYYVQSPSRDSHEEDLDKSSSSASATQGTRTSSDAMSLLSRMTLASRISGGGHGYFRRKGRRERGRFLGRRDGEGLEGVEEDEEEEDEKEMYVNWWRDEQGEELSTSCKVLLLCLFLGVFFFVGCFIVWCVSRSFVAHVHLKNMKVNNFYYGEGSDIRGVPTKIVTVNCTLNLTVHNSATFFGIHVRCSTITLRYYDLTIASGQMNAYYQPKKSWRNMKVNIEGRNVALYGAGASFVLSDDGNGVPLIMEFVMWTHGNVVGKLVKTKHRRYFRCFLNISSDTQIAKLTGHSCI